MMTNPGHNCIMYPTYFSFCSFFVPFISEANAIWLMASFFKESLDVIIKITLLKFEATCFSEHFDMYNVKRHKRILIINIINNYLHSVNFKRVVVQ